MSHLEAYTEDELKKARQRRGEAVPLRFEKWLQDWGSGGYPPCEPAF